MVPSVPGPARSPTGRGEEGGEHGDQLAPLREAPMGGRLAEGEPPFLRHHGWLTAMLTLELDMTAGPRRLRGPVACGAPSPARPRRL